MRLLKYISVNIISETKENYDDGDMFPEYKQVYFEDDWIPLEIYHNMRTIEYILDKRANKNT